MARYSLIHSLTPCVFSTVLTLETVSLAGDKLVSVLPWMCQRHLWTSHKHCTYPRPQCTICCSSNTYDQWQAVSQFSNNISTLKSFASFQFCECVYCFFFHPARSMSSRKWNSAQYSVTIHYCAVVSLINVFWNCFSKVKCLFKNIPLYKFKRIHCISLQYGGSYNATCPLPAPKLRTLDISENRFFCSHYCNTL